MDINREREKQERDGHVKKTNNEVILFKELGVNVLRVCKQSRSSNRVSEFVVKLFERGSTFPEALAPSLEINSFFLLN